MGLIEFIQSLSGTIGSGGSGGGGGGGEILWGDDEILMGSITITFND